MDFLPPLRVQCCGCGSICGGLCLPKRKGGGGEGGERLFNGSHKLTVMHREGGDAWARKRTPDHTFSTEQRSNHRVHIQQCQPSRQLHYGYAVVSFVSQPKPNSFTAFSLNGRQRGRTWMWWKIQDSGAAVKIKAGGGVSSWRVHAHVRPSVYLDKSSPGNAVMKHTEPLCPLKEPNDPHEAADRPALLGT